MKIKANMIILSQLKFYVKNVMLNKTLKVLNQLNSNKILHYKKILFKTVVCLPLKKLVGGR